MEYTISGSYPVKTAFEISVDVNGHNYLVIYGKHVNGGFCCIPNWCVACEMGEPSDIVYNTEALVKRRVSKKSAKAIASAICAANDQFVDE